MIAEKFCVRFAKLNKEIEPNKKTSVADFATIKILFVRSSRAHSKEFKRKGKNVCSVP